MFKWLELLSLTDIVISLREYLSPTREFIPDWVVFSSPDGLWVYSFSSSFILIWNEDFAMAKPWLIIPLFVGAFAEIFQYFKILPGTFDLIDFFVCITASILSIYFVKRKILKK